jgi:phosphate transport system substrate-binding protein
MRMLTSSEFRHAGVARSGVRLNAFPALAEPGRHASTSVRDGGRRRAVGVVLGVLLLAWASSACRRSPEGGSTVTTSGIVEIDGSSTVFPITEAVAEEFRRATKIDVTVGVSGTGGGFQKFCRGEIDIADASRPIGEQELATCKASGVTFVELPIAYDGLTIVVNPKNTWTTSLTVAELKKLWEPAAEGKITKWSQVRAGWPDREIHLFGAGVDSGTFDYFTEAIVGKARASRGDYTSSEDDNMLVQGVSGDENALGYFGYAYYEENRDKLKAVPVDDADPSNGQGPVMPSVETVRQGTYRPLSRPVFIYVSTKSLAKPDVKKFVDFYMANATELVREVGYVPLSESEYRLVSARAEARTPGTAFRGHRLEPGTTLEQLLSRAP